MFSIKALADLLFSYIDQSGTAGPTGDVTNATTLQKTWIALAMTQALKDARKINPGVFVRRPGIVLRAPTTGTITVTQYSTATTSGTLTPPNDGCTVRFDTNGIDNELNVTGTPGTYALRREHDGATGTLSPTLWHDCWVAADGADYESVLGDVKANGRPIVVVTDPADLDRYRLFRDFGQVAMSRQRHAGPVQAVCCEHWASPYTKKIQTRLRFAPMPDVATVVEATLVLAAPVIAVADVTSTTAYAFQIPQALDETLLFPLAMKRFMAMPFFRAPEETRAELREQYTEAVNTLKLLRGHYAAFNRIESQG